MRNPIQFFVPAVACLSLLSGCAVNPPYPFAKDEKTASVRLFNMDSATLCKAEELYKIAPALDAIYAQIPATERVSLTTHMSYGGHNVIYSCNPAISFIPQENATYVLHNYVRDSRCFLEVAREDGSTATGVALEPSIDRVDCFPKKK